MQVSPPGVEGPGWAMAAITGAFVILWLLNAIGKLPGSTPKNGPGAFGPEHRDQLADLHRVVTREDQDKPGWPMVWNSARETREIRDLLKELVDLKDVWEEDRGDWKQESARMSERITVLEDQLRQSAR